MENKIDMAYKALGIKDFSDALADWLLTITLIGLSVTVILSVVALFSSKALVLATMLGEVTLLMGLLVLILRIVVMIAITTIKLCGWSEVELEGMKGLGMNG